MARPRITKAETVLEAATRHLASHGIADTNIDDIADAAGVSRATVYRYVGGKDEIVAATIGQGAEEVLTQVEAAIASSPSLEAAFATAVSTSLGAIAEHPLLARLTTIDLADTLPYLTVLSGPIVESSVARLTETMSALPGSTSDDRAISAAIEEATRFTLAHLTTPRTDGTRMTPDEAGVRAAAMVSVIL